MPFQDTQSVHIYIYILAGLVRIYSSKGHHIMFNVFQKIIRRKSSTTLKTEIFAAIIFSTVSDIYLPNARGISSDFIIIF